MNTCMHECMYIYMYLPRHIDALEILFNSTRGAATVAVAGVSSKVRVTIVRLRCKVTNN